MPINELLIREFKREMDATKKTLQRVPKEKWDWKPHEKFWFAGLMAGHVASLPGFIIRSAQRRDRRRKPRYQAPEGGEGRGSSGAPRQARNRSLRGPGAIERRSVQRALVAQARR